MSSRIVRSHSSCRQHANRCAICRLIHSGGVSGYPQSPDFRTRRDDESWREYGQAYQAWRSGKPNDATPYGRGS